MDLGLRNRKVLVTGASYGIGAAIAEGFAKEGSELAIVARSPERLHGVAEQLRKTCQGTVHEITADLSTPEGIDTILAFVNTQWQGIDVLVNNTGGPPAGSFESFDIEEWQRQAEGLLFSVVRMVRGVIPHMRTRQWGRIITISSVAAKEPTQNLVLSNTYRAGLLALTKTLATELAADNILVNGVLPGFTETERIVELAEVKAHQQGVSTESIMEEFRQQIPLKRLAKPEEIAAMVIFLASQQASYLTGNNIHVDGGRSKGYM